MVENCDSPLPIDCPERREIAREAGVQIEVLVDMLCKAARTNTDCFEDLVIAVAVRVKHLSGVVMSAASDAGATAGDMKEILYG